MDDVVIGGAVGSSGQLAAAFEVLLADLMKGPSFEEVRLILDGLYDAQLNGECNQLSVGLRAAALLDPAP